jgi:hypothetical protein
MPNGQGVAEASKLFKEQKELVNCYRWAAAHHALRGWRRPLSGDPEGMPLDPGRAGYF